MRKVSEQMTNNSANRQDINLIIFDDVNNVSNESVSEANIKISDKSELKVINSTPR